MATEPKRIYLDPNFLAYIANTKAPQHRAALEVFKDFSWCSQIKAIDPSHL